MPPTLPITIVGSSRRRPSEYAALVFEKKSSGESTFKGKGKRAAVTEEAIIVLKSKDGFIWNVSTSISLNSKAETDESFDRVIRLFLLS